MRFRAHQDDARSATRRLLVLFAVLLLALVLAINGLLYGLWWLLLGWAFELPAFFFETNTAIVLLFVLGGCVVETARLRLGGGEHVARWAGGREVLDPHDRRERRLLNVVQEMALASGLPPPRVYVLEREDSAINAFACGWQPENAVIAVTRGALERLTRDELQGLVAHEFGHIQQDDLRLQMVLLALVWGLSLVHSFGVTQMQAEVDGRLSPVRWAVGLVFVVAGSLGWLAGRVLQAAVSRQRELLADACAVQFTRSRDGLGGTLRKVWHQAERGQDDLHRVPARLLAAMLLQAPSGWLASHPPLRERLRRLYGREVEPLPAPVLELRDDRDPARPSRPAKNADRQTGIEQAGAVPLAYAAGMCASAVLPALAPVAPSGAEPAASARSPASATVPTPRALTRPELSEVTGRLSRLNGQGELRAAILALLLTPGSRRERRAWREETREVGSAERLADDIDQLGPAERLPWLETLLDRAARGALADRQSLVEAARRVMSADGLIRPIDRLVWLAMRRHLAPPPPVPPAHDAHNDLALLPEGMRQQLVRLTAFLSRVIPDGQPEAGAAWHEAVTRPWMGSALPCEPPDADGLVHALSEAQLLPWMLRPVLLRTWLDAAVAASPLGRLDPQAADALRLVAYLLDSPLPPDLARLYIDTPAV